ncbi:MAG: hypothetical protein ABI220_02220 [Candidatus Saccharimonadales bacterium]
MRNGELGPRGHSDDAHTTESDRVFCARLDVLRMVQGDPTAKEHIADGFTEDEQAGTLHYKCPVNICGAIINFTPDGGSNRDGDCAVVMSGILESIEHE